MPTNNANNNQNNNNMNTFNLMQPQNNPQQQQNNFGGFDFTNSNIPQNKERIEQQNKLSQLENVLNSLSMQPQSQPNNNFMGNPMMGNMGMGMNNNMNFMNMNNNNNMGMGGGMNMNNMNNMRINNKPDPFADLTFPSKNNQGNNTFNNQQSTNNNPFSFI